MVAFEYSNPNKYSTVHYWLFSSLRPEKENDFEFDENKAKLARLSYFCLLLLSFASGRLPISLVTLFSQLREDKIIIHATNKS